MTNQQTMRGAFFIPTEKHAKTPSYRVALAGIFAGLCVVTLFLGSAVPFSTFITPGLAGLFIALAASETGLGAGALLYASVAAVAFLLVPDKEIALLFATFWGFYPALKPYIDRLQNKGLKMFLKLLLLNLGMGIFLLLMFLLFPIYIEGFAGEVHWTAVVWFVLLINGAFFLYDRALSAVFFLYKRMIRPRVEKAGLHK